MMIEQQSQRSASPTCAALHRSGEEMIMALTVRVLGLNKRRRLHIRSREGTDLTLALLEQSGALDLPIDRGGIIKTINGIYVCEQTTYNWWSAFRHVAKCENDSALIYGTDRKNNV